MKPKNIKEFYFKEGCYIEEWLNHIDHPEMSVARVRVEPHSVTKLHVLNNTSERYVILSGNGLVTVAGKSWDVQDKDVVTVKPGQAQKIANQTDQDLIFLAICSPRFEEKNYQEIAQ